MVVSLAFINGFHYWPIIKWFPPCSTSTPLFRMVRIRTFFGQFGLKTLGLPVALSSFAIAQVAQDLVILYMTFCWDIDPPCIFVAMVDSWAWIHLVHLCHDSFRFYMVPVCILRDHDSYISYTYVGSTCILMDIFCIWTCMSQRSVLSDIYLSFKYLCSSLLILDSLFSPFSVVLFILYFFYHLGPLTSYIRGHML